MNFVQHSLCTDAIKLVLLWNLNDNAQTSIHQNIFIADQGFTSGIHCEHAYLRIMYEAQDKELSFCHAGDKQWS